MNKLYALLLFILISSLSAQAQQPDIAIRDSVVKPLPYCGIPYNGELTLKGGVQNMNAGDTVFMRFDWGDGTISYDTVFVTAQQAYVSPYYYPLRFSTTVFHTYLAAGYYSVEVIATSQTGAIDTIWLSPIDLTATCNTIIGYVYDDQNNNCLYNYNEDPIEHRNVIVRDSSGNYVNHGLSDSNGYYSITLPTNLVDAEALVYSGYNTSVDCPSSGVFVFNSDSNQFQNFSLDCEQSIEDALVYSNAVVPPPGDTGWARFWVYRNSCGNLSYQDTLTVVIDSQVTYLGMLNGPNPNMISGDTFKWYFTHTTTQPSLWRARLGLYVQMEILSDTTLSLNDTAKFYSSCTVPQIDTNHLNNSDSTWILVGLPYDPNNKLVTPQGLGVEGKIDTSIHQLMYTINFQNTGTARARNVVVYDTLPSELDRTTLEIVDYSFPVEVKSYDDQAIRFYFNNIYLPDSASDPEGSMGHVTFRINRKKNLSLGTQIKNRVGIYFDYNPPIMTEYAINTLYAAPVPPVEPDSLQIEVSASDVTCLDSDNGTASLTILEGNPPYTITWNTGSDAMMIDDLSAGTYSVTVTDNDTQQVTAQAVVEEDRQFASPVVGDVSGPMSVESWKSYQYALDNVEGHEFMWNAFGGEVLEQDGNEADILWYGGPTGAIIITETDEHGCFASKETEVPILFVGVKENDLNAIELFPNPTADEFIVKNVEAGNTLVEVYELSGRLMISQTIRSANDVINVSELSSGMYLVHLTIDGASQGTKMLVKE